MADSIQDAIEDGVGRRRMFVGAAAIWAAGLVVAVFGIWHANTGAALTVPAFATTYTSTPRQATCSCPADQSVAIDEGAGAALDETTGAMVFPADELVVRPAIVEGRATPLGVTEVQPF